MSAVPRDIHRAIGRLGRLRLQARSLYLAHGLARVLLVATLLAGASYLLDRLLVLPRPVRTLLFFASAAWVALEGMRRVVRPLRNRLSDDDLAAAVERRFPALGDRLLSAVQLARDLEDPGFADSRALAEATIRDAARAIEPVPFRRALRPGPTRASVACALAALLLGSAYASWRPQYASVWFRRWVALQDVRWPRQTFLEVILPQRGRNLFVTGDGDREVVTLASGEDLLVRVKANGRVPAEVAITYDVDSQGRRRRERRVLGKVGKRDFQYNFVGVTESLDFFVTGGDDQSGDPVYHVRVLPPPRVASLRLDCSYPPYTGLSDAPLEGGDLEAPAGTRVRLRLETTEDVERAFLVLDEATRSPLERTGPRAFRGGFEVERDLLYSFLLQGTNGLRNTRPVRYSLHAIPDAPPSLEVFAGGGMDFDATPQAAIPIRVLTTDDYGVTAVRLLCRLGRDTPALEVSFGEDAHVADGIVRERKEGPFPVARRLLSLSRLDLATLSFPESDASLEPGDILIYQVVAEDNHTDPDGGALPQSKQTKPFRIHVVQRSELERKLNDWQVRLKGEIRKVRGTQERLRDTVAQIDELDDGEDRLAPGDAQQILDAEFDQNRVTNEMRRITRELRQIFNMYLYNRIENSPLTEKLMDRLQETARRFDVEELERYRILFRQTPASERERSDILGKQLTVLEIGLRVSQEGSPETTRRLTAARKNPSGSERRRLLGEAVRGIEAILRDLDTLLAKMQEWEDYQEVLQETKELLEMQEEIKNRTLREIQKMQGGTTPR